MKLTKEEHMISAPLAWHRPGRYDHHSYSALPHEEPRAPCSCSYSNTAAHSGRTCGRHSQDNDKPRLPSPGTNRHTKHNNKRARPHKKQRKQGYYLKKEKKQRLHEIETLKQELD
jgi:hypothetical protein